MGTRTLDRPATRPPEIVVDAPDETGAESPNDVSERDPRYVFVLHNDPINTFGFVVRVLQKVLGCGAGRAWRLTVQAHFFGCSRVWTGPLEIAELRAEQIQGCGPDLSCPAARPLRVSVEPLDAA